MAIGMVWSAASTAAGGIFFPLYPDLDNITGSANPRAHGYCVRRTVVDTGATLHAGIKINDIGFVLPHFKNRPGTYLGTQGAADTFFFIQYQG